MTKQDEDAQTEKDAEDSSQSGEGSMGTSTKEEIVQSVLDKREHIHLDNERATVIAGASRLEALVQDVLKSYLRPNPTSEDELFDGVAPLSSFSSNINLAHRLGLIDSEFARILHLIRKTRNTYAHQMEVASLDEGPVGNRMKHIMQPFKGENSVVDRDWTELSGHDKFRIALDYCLLSLEIAEKKTATLDGPKEPIGV